MRVAAEHVRALRGGAAQGEDARGVAGQAPGRDGRHVGGDVLAAQRALGAGARVDEAKVDVGGGAVKGLLQTFTRDLHLDRAVALAQLHGQGGAAIALGLRVEANRGCDGLAVRQRLGGRWGGGQREVLIAHELTKGDHHRHAGVIGDLEAELARAVSKDGAPEVQHVGVDGGGASARVDRRCVHASGVHPACVEARAHIHARASIHLTAPHVRGDAGITRLNLSWGTQDLAWIAWTAIQSQQCAQTNSSPHSALLLAVFIPPHICCRERPKPA